MAQNYNTTGGMRWEDGDFNYDGNVDFLDQAILAQQYNSSLPTVVSLLLPLGVAMTLRRRRHTRRQGNKTGRMDQTLAALRRCETLEDRTTLLRGTAQARRANDLAAQTAVSSHSPWRLARSLALSIALPNRFWGRLGVERVAWNK